MKVLIVDNEPNARLAIEAILKAFCPTVTQIAQAGGVVEGIRTISEFHPDLVLLDVEMDDGSGFDLLNRVEHTRFHVIFITAHNKYAVDAFRFAAIDFLLKPVDPDELAQAIQRSEQSLKAKYIAEQYRILTETLHAGSNRQEKRIVLKDSTQIHVLKVNEIIFCEADRNYTRFHIISGASILVSKNLKEYETLLEPYGFIRPHHSYLVNVQKLLRMDRTDGGILVLEGNHEIPVSQRKRDQVIELLDKM